MTEQYKCPSYYDDDGVLQDCTCGKCGSKADWLRSEIEKLESSEKMKSKIGFEKDGTKMQQIKQRVYAQGHNQALTSIITRYKEELKELEKGI